MTDRLPWFPFYASDFLMDERVMLMTMEERGAYITLLCVNWREGSIPTDLGALARMLHMDADRTKDVWGVVGQCFKQCSSSATARASNARLDVVRAEQEERHKSKVDAGRKGGKAKSANNLRMPSTAKAQLKHSSSNQNQSQTKTKKNPPTPLQGDEYFEIWWKAYPRKVSKLQAHKAYDKARKRGVTSEALLENLTLWLPKWRDTEIKFIPHAATWLNAGNGDSPPEVEKAPGMPRMDRAQGATVRQAFIRRERAKALAERQNGNGHV